MNKDANPIDFLIEFAWASGADIFVVNNAKDELKKLRLTNDTLLKAFQNPVAYAKTNERNDLYDLRTQNNPYDDQNKVVPLYSNREEFLKGKWRENNYGKYS